MKKVFAVLKEQECGCVEPSLVALFSSFPVADKYIFLLKSCPSNKYERYFIEPYDVLDYVEVFDDELQSS